MKSTKMQFRNISLLLVMVMVVQLCAGIGTVFAEPAAVIIDDGGAGYSQSSTGAININSEGRRDSLDLISYGGTLRDFNPGVVGQYAQL